MKKRILLGACWAAGLLSALAQTSRSRIDDGWTFRLVGKDTVAHSVDLPHDWSILADFEENQPSGNDGGYALTGKGVYEKTLRLKKADLAMRHALYFEGVYMDAQVWVNDSLAGGHPYGYTSFEVDATPYLREGLNRITVTVDNSRQKNCRWYSGSGIYRHVYWVSRGAVTLPADEVFFSTPKVTAGEAALRIQALIQDTSEGDAYTVKAALSRDGQTVWTTETTSGRVIDIDGLLEQPALWSPEEPNLYTLTLSVGKEGRIHDTFTQEVGIRSIRYSAEEGFVLNGRPVAVYGGCVHHDHGMLGARSYDAAEARKVRLLKEAGFNAVRTSHNPPAPAFLAECDRQGLLVVDEAFDGWREAKLPQDYHLLFDEWWERDIQAMVRRDRNHPSIICWSTGNEVMERKKLEVVTTAHRLAEACRALDATRPVTSALCSWDSDWEIYDPLAAEHDIVGYNYMMFKAEGDHARVPSRVMWQTESYPVEAFKSWAMLNDHPYVIGDFVWTAMDYLGESGIGRHFYESDTGAGEHFTGPQWPWHGAYCGDIDITGYQKPISHYRSMLFGSSAPIYMAVREPNGYKGEIRTTLWSTVPTLRSWNWEGHEGKPVEVVVASRAPRVRLYQNDRLVGEKPTTRAEEFKAVFAVPYEPGALRAVAVDAEGHETDATDHLATAGQPVRLRLSADRLRLSADNQDLAYLTIEVLDAEGRVVPDQPVEVTASAFGAGEVIATGSGDMTDRRGYYCLTRTTWQGRAAAVVKAGKRKGIVRVKVMAKGMEGDEISIRL
jgi:beta-galactosidase